MGWDGELFKLKTPEDDLRYASGASRDEVAHSPLGDIGVIRGSLARAGIVVTPGKREDVWVVDGAQIVATHHADADGLVARVSLRASLRDDPRRQLQTLCRLLCCWGSDPQAARDVPPTKMDTPVPRDGFHAGLGIEVAFLRVVLEAGEVRRQEPLGTTTAVDATIDRVLGEVLNAHGAGKGFDLEQGLLDEMYREEPLDHVLDAAHNDDIVWGASFLVLARGKRNPLLDRRHPLWRALYSLSNRLDCGAFVPRNGTLRELAFEDDGTPAGDLIWLGDCSTDG